LVQAGPIIAIMIFCLVPNVMKAFILLLMIGIGLSTVEVKRQKRNDPASELYTESEIDQLKAKIATVGVELTKIGIGFSFQKVWNQVVERENGLIQSRRGHKVKAA
jgi:predicted xylose isomerase-like sugar epimerase